ncbi:MAG: Holliday junction resolvase RuvX [Gammaproteobacteria bacterium]|nr:Holliday junction resolvase RuvX [Gammaproteobacteria bacterium]
MPALTFLAFDYGKTSIGVAVGSTLSGQAQDLATVKSVSGQPDWKHISTLVQEWQPQGLVVGLPLNMDDSESPTTTAAREFGNRLGDRYNLSVHMVDERLTTVAARRSLAQSAVPMRRHKSRLDRVAAQTILQTFLDEQTRADLKREP